MFVVKHRFNWNLCTIQCSASDTNIFKSTQIILIDCLEWYWTRKKNYFRKIERNQADETHKFLSRTNSIRSLQSLNMKRKKKYFSEVNQCNWYSLLFSHIRWYNGAWFATINVFSAKHFWRLNVANTIDKQTCSPLVGIVSDEVKWSEHKNKIHADDLVWLCVCRRFGAFEKYVGLT